MRGDIAEQLRNHALRQVIGFDAVIDRELLQSRHKSPMPADHTLDQPLVRKMIQPFDAAIALTGCIYKREICNRLIAFLRLLSRLKKALFERDGNLFRKADTDKSAGRNRIARSNQPHSFSRSDDLASLDMARG